LPPARRARGVPWTLPLAAYRLGELSFELRERGLDERLEGAAHATFRRDARVECEAIKTGRPVLAGAKQDLVLDFFSSATSDTRDDSFTTFVGIQVDDALRVTEVTPQGIA